MYAKPPTGRVVGSWLRCAGWTVQCDRTSPQDGKLKNTEPSLGLQIPPEKVVRVDFLGLTTF